MATPKMTKQERVEKHVGPEYSEPEPLILMRVRGEEGKPRVEMDSSYTVVKLYDDDGAVRTFRIIDGVWQRVAK